MVRFFNREASPPVEADAIVLLDELRGPEGDSIVDGIVYELRFRNSDPDTPQMSNDILRGFPTASVTRRAVIDAIESYTGEPYLQLPSGVLKAAKEAGPVNSTLKLVAEIYSFWERVGGNPIAEITEAFKISRSTATRWVRKARDEGYIDRLVTEKRKSTKRSDGATS